MQWYFFALGAGAAGALSCSADSGATSENGPMEPEPMMPAPPPAISSSPVPTSTTPVPPPTSSVPEVDAGPPPRDPTVRFDWPEATLDGPCQAGVYQGTFSCSIPAGLFGTPITVTGPVQFTLAESENGEFLEITDGVLNGDAMGILFTSELAGNLDCVTNEFAADALNGTYGTPPLFGGTFAGALQAQLDRSSQTLNGQWQLSPNGFSPCVGPWSATRQP